MMGKRDDLILKLDSSMMCTSNFFTRVKPKSFRIEKRNAQLKTKNKTCFVIGNGPSLSTKDLEIIKNYDSINVNYFYEGVKDYRGKYLVLIDPGFCNEHGLAYLKKCSESNSELLLITSKSNYQYFINNNAFPENRMFAVNISLKQHGMFISTDLCRMMTGSLNIIPVAIELAIGLGYKNIYLLGCDFSFYGTANIGKHFYDNGEYKVHESYNSVGNLLRCALVQQHHFAIAKYCSEKGITIKNATPGSMIMAYEPISIQEILK